jgi:sugar phosphate isomerase/epimerase
MNRRQANAAIAAIGAAALSARNVAADAQAAAEKDGGPKAGVTQGRRTRPMICGYSGNLAKVFYPQLGLIAQQIGYEGIELTVMNGGHVNPGATNVDLVRAIESVRGASLEVPMIATTIAGPSDPTAYPILAITGRTDVHLYRMGAWAWGADPNPQRRIVEFRANLANLLQLGRQCEMVAMFPNHAAVGGQNFIGSVIWDVHPVISDLDPALIGYYFDPSQTQDWEIALRLVLPRLKAVGIQDVIWDKVGATWVRKACPLGEGIVDWPLFFHILAQANFTGPVSIHLDYPAPDPLGAMTKDLEFVRKEIAAAYKA